jgi:hypothetical protein
MTTTPHALLHDRTQENRARHRIVLSTRHLASEISKRKNISRYSFLSTCLPYTSYGTLLLATNKPIRLLRGKRRTDLTPLDLAENDGWGLLHSNNVLRVTLSRTARSSIATIKPVHEPTLIPPNTHSKHHTPRHGLAHTLHSAQVHERRSALGLAVLVVHADIGGDVFNHFAVLHVLADDGLEDAVFSGELGDDGEGLVSINALGASGAVVGFVGCVGVFAAAVLVADSSCGALIAGAAVETGLRAGVGSDLGGTLVGFPDVELVAAEALGFDIGLGDVN